MTTKSIRAAFLVLFIFCLSAPAHAQDEAKRLVALLDYLGGDYKNAVQNGKVVNQDEYGEMQEFSKRVQELFDRLKATDADKAGIESTLKSLAREVEAKGDPKLVAELAWGAKDKLIAAYKIVPYPRQFPSLAAGKQVFLENCAQCHGESGRGDGPARSTMNPKTPPPADFTDADFMGGLSPFKAFNTATFGIDNTAMASFTALPEEQRWEVAFYVLSLRFSHEQAARGEKLVQGKKQFADLTGLAALSTHTDEDLADKLNESLPDERETADGLAYLRRGLLEKTADPLALARTYLRDAAALYAQGEKEKAYQKAVDAYLEGFELVEPALFARDASFGRALEVKFTQFRNALKQGAPADEVQRQLSELEAGLDQASRILTLADAFSGYYAFLNSALIILREGLEAALIIAAILAMLRVMGAAEAIRYIHWGWILALVAGGLTWLATETVLTLSGRHRESMEGFISVFAALALFYVGYWLHTHGETRKWQSFVQAKVKGVFSGKKILGLMGISFFAVYREAFEVVLFYQALWLQKDASHGALISGFITGVAALAVATVTIFKLGLRLPLKYFFGATGVLLYVMAFIFTGNGIKDLQAAGWVPSTVLDIPLQLPVLGIYPTLETLAAQALMLVAFAASVWIARGNEKAVS